jgi:hypothetical protein
VPEIVAVTAEAVKSKKYTFMSTSAIVPREPKSY